MDRFTLAFLVPAVLASCASGAGAPPDDSAAAPTAAGTESTTSRAPHTTRPAPREGPSTPLPQGPPGAAIFKRGDERCFIHAHPPCPPEAKCDGPAPPMQEIEVACPDAADGGEAVTP